MSTLITTNIKHPSSSSNNLVLTSGGGVTGAGKILQIQSTTKKDIVSTNSSSFALITGLTVSITPTSSSNKIWIMYNLAIGTDTNAYTRLRLARGSTTDINIGDASGDHTRCTHFRFMSNAGVSAGDWSDVDTWHFAGNYLDSPSTTSSTTYGLYWAVDDATLKLNTVHATSYGDDVGTSTSTITAMEVAA